MTMLIKFPGHRLHRCSSDTCQVCLGGLAWCTTCGGAEGDLPTDCPQERMHEDERAAVANGHLDYVRGRWICVSEESRRPI